MTTLLKSHILGFPRIGARRELKKALETYWGGNSSQQELLAAGAALRAKHWIRQKAAGIDWIPSNDFSLYDQVLDMSVLVGAVPQRFGGSGHGKIDIDTYFVMARGVDTEHSHTTGTNAMEMTKWFDTNYHYLVPEFAADQEFRLASSKPLDEFREALALGIRTVPVLLGPVSFLLLGKSHEEAEGKTAVMDALLARLLPVYIQVLKELGDAGAEWVQMDEPCLATDLTPSQKGWYETAYRVLSERAGPRLMLAVYFGALGDNLDLACRLPVQGLHIDASRAPMEVAAVCAALPADSILSVGIVDGRNVWRNDFAASLAVLRDARRILGAERLLVSSSCSLLHVPYSLKPETVLDAEMRGWLAFAEEKLHELTVLARFAGTDDESGSDTDLRSAWAENQAAIEGRRTSSRVHDEQVASRLSAVSEADLRRTSVFAVRQVAQQAGLCLPLFPTTTIGSLPQTTDIRATRARFKRGELNEASYEAFLTDHVRQAVRWQEAAGLDVLVHGEFERNDMVEYFGEQMAGFAFTRNGWVQSYGSRCVKPPIIFGDVSRPMPMTVGWARLAQSLTSKPMKGMLTGPVTILQWSFVRDDQPRRVTAQQIALALRDEVIDLEAAGIKVIQVDEPALREGLPLRRTDWDDYLRWAVAAFRLASSGVRDETQIHTHMCYCEFNDIIQSIASLDADVISIETARSQSELLDAFSQFQYPNAVGPGVWDIHSPRVPSVEEMASLLHASTRVIPAERLWVNPDCGLKTRSWDEVRPAIRHMVECAAAARRNHSS